MVGNVKIRAAQTGMKDRKENWMGSIRKKRDRKARSAGFLKRGGWTLLMFHHTEKTNRQGFLRGK